MTGDCEILILMAKKNLSNQERKKVLWFLQEKSCTKNQNVLARGAVASAADMFNCSRDVVRLIWKRANDTGGTVDSRIKGTSGRKKIDRSSNLKAMSKVPMKNRQTTRALAHSISMHTTSVHRMLRENKITRVSSTVKHFLSMDNQKQRLQFALNNIHAATKKFTKLSNRVHVDEKWFYI